MKRWLVVGLGNPGQQYQNTRHNIGFFVVDRLVACLNARYLGSFSTFELWAAVCADGEMYFMKPTTFMNLSGDALVDFLTISPVPLAHVMVAFDDVALPLGTLRIRPTGSGGGHKGMNHIIAVLSSKSIPRVRLGIDAQGRLGRELRDYVLEPFDEGEADLVDRVVHRATQAVETWFHKDLDRVMGTFNGSVVEDADNSTSHMRKT